MAEFCKECLIKICEVDLKNKKFIMSKDLDFCEECGEMKPVVAKIVFKNPIRQFIVKRRGY